MIKSRKQHGFSLVEILLALTILAILLASICAAFEGSLTSYRENDEVAAATQLGRSILTRMTREIRTCSDINSTETQVVVTPYDNGSGLTQIVYELENGILYYRQTVNSQQTSYPLLGSGDNSSVTSFSIVREDDLEGNPISATIHLELAVDNTPLILNASAVLRKQLFD